MTLIMNTRYNYATGLFTDLGTEPSRVQRHFADETNINRIMERFRQGTPLPVATGGSYVDLTTTTNDYQVALNQINEANAAFASLPAAVRKRFGNNPSEMLAALSDPDFHEEGVKLGLFNPPVASTTVDPGKTQPTPSQASSSPIGEEPAAAQNT